MVELDDVASAPFKRGGRDASGIDCLGVVLIASRELGHPLRDPWQHFLEVWRDRGQVPDMATGFPDSWRRIEYDGTGYLADMRDGDVWLWNPTCDRYPGCAIVIAGLLTTALPDAGLVRLPPQKVQAPNQVWRP